MWRYANSRSMKKRHKKLHCTDLAIIDINALESPAPVPVHEYAGLSVVDSDVSQSKLLVADPYAIFSWSYVWVCVFEECDFGNLPPLKMRSPKKPPLPSTEAMVYIVVIFNGNISRNLLSINMPWWAVLEAVLISTLDSVSIVEDQNTIFDDWHTGYCRDWLLEILASEVP